MKNSKTAEMVQSMPSDVWISVSPHEGSERLPEAGYVNGEGVYVLPSDWDNVEDDIYGKI